MDPRPLCPLFCRRTRGEARPSGLAGIPARRRARSERTGDGRNAGGKAIIGGKSRKEIRRKARTDAGAAARLLSRRKEARQTETKIRRAQTHRLQDIEAARATRSTRSFWGGTPPFFAAPIAALPKRDRPGSTRDAAKRAAAAQICAAAALFSIKRKLQATPAGTRSGNAPCGENGRPPIAAHISTSSAASSYKSCLSGRFGKGSAASLLERIGPPDTYRRRVVVIKAHPADRVLGIEERIDGDVIRPQPHRRAAAV